jgi:hypothetical protein
MPMRTSTSQNATRPQAGLIQPFVWALVLLTGAGVWIACAMGADSDRAWRAMLINFLYFTPLAVGMVVWPAVVMLARGEWARPVERYALAGVAFAPVSLLAYIALVLGRSHWAGWITPAGPAPSAWLDSTFLFARNALGLLLIWVIAAVFARGLFRSRPRALAGWLAFLYTIVFSLVAFDLVMSLDPQWFSTLFGAYFFVTGMYGALAMWIVIVLIQQSADENRRADLGSLLIAFSMMSTYMMFSQLIVIWYENFPEEVRFVLPRMTQPPWRWVSAVLLAVIYLGPLVTLISRWAKRTPVFLGSVAVVVLAGLWAERWWLVTPTLGGALTFGLTEISITAAFLAAFALGVTLFLRRTVARPTEGPP